MSPSAGERRSCRACRGPWLLWFNSGEKNSNNPVSFALATNWFGIAIYLLFFSSPHISPSLSSHPWSTKALISSLHLRCLHSCSQPSYLPSFHSCPLKSPFLNCPLLILFILLSLTSFLCHLTLIPPLFQCFDFHQTSLLIPCPDASVSSSTLFARILLLSPLLILSCISSSSASYSTFHAGWNSPRHTVSEVKVASFIRRAISWRHDPLAQWHTQAKVSFSSEQKSLSRSAAVTWCFLTVWKKLLLLEIIFHLLSCQTQHWRWAHIRCLYINCIWFGISLSDMRKCSVLSWWCLCGIVMCQAGSL